MPLSARLFLFIGALNAALVVIAGAYGAHAFKAQASAAQAATFQTAVQYHMFHALGLLLIGVIAAVRPGSTLLVWAGAMMLAGIVLFCGSLYGGALTGYRLSAVAPFGGTAFIVAWLLLAVAALRA
jgi:uncharacterized membrane protein YgdD (TMEM256/DUF423 family)